MPRCDLHLRLQGSLTLQKAYNLAEAVWLCRHDFTRLEFCHCADFYQNFTAFPLPLPKLDLLAVPGKVGLYALGFCLL